MEQSIDLNTTLITDKESTFYGRVKGNSMEDANIHEGDVLIIDRAKEAIQMAKDINKNTGQLDANLTKVIPKKKQVDSENTIGKLTNNI